MKSLRGIKSLTFIFTLALMLTIGAVYAVFVYAQSSPDAVEGNFKSNVITGATVDGKKGTIAFGENTLQLKVHNKGDNTTTLQAIDGSVTATLTPDPNADDDVKNNGIVWGLKVEFVGTNQYNEQAILTTTATAPVKLNNGTKSKTITLDNEVLSQYIQVTEFTLQTKADYDNYSAAFKAVTIKITLSEYVDVGA